MIHMPFIYCFVNNFVDVLSWVTIHDLFIFQEHFTLYLEIWTLNTVK